MPTQMRLSFISIFSDVKEHDFLLKQTVFFFVKKDVTSWWRLPLNNSERTKEQAARNKHLKYEWQNYHKTSMKLSSTERRWKLSSTFIEEKMFFLRWKFPSRNCSSKEGLGNTWGCLPRPFIDHIFKDFFLQGNFPLVFHKQSSKVFCLYGTYSIKDWPAALRFS